MIIYLGNHSSLEFGYLQGKYGNMGWLLSPKSLPKTKLRSFIPVAFDNDAYSVKEGEAWNEEAWYSMLDKLEERKVSPEFVLLPDVVGDKRRTLENFFVYREAVSRRGWPVAISVCEGMKPQDIPCTADVIFVGGKSLKYKFDSLPMWCQAFPRVHCGRVNSLKLLHYCYEHGVESVDGTHWFRFRKPEEYLQDFISFFEDQKNE